MVVGWLACYAFDILRILYIPVNPIFFRVITLPDGETLVIEFKHGRVNDIVDVTTGVLARLEPATT